MGALQQMVYHPKILDSDQLKLVLNLETCNISQAFLPLTVTKLSTLKTDHFLVHSVLLSVTLLNAEQFLNPSSSYSEVW